MSKLGFMSRKCLKLSRLPVLKTAIRTFLSEAYRCGEAWEKRLESPLLKKVNTHNLYQELDWQFSHFGRASVIDVDIFLNATTKKGFMEDVEDIIHKLRLSPDTTDTLPSTHHAAVRLLLDAGKTNTLQKIMTDRLGYGIFPDHFCLNLLMDTFLKEGKYAAAARVGVSQMLQEDWDNILTTRLSLYSCHMFLRNPEQTWFTDEEIIPPVPEPKETIKVRVKFIRKPYFDDHFDLKDPMIMVGKTLSMFSSKVGGSEHLSHSYKLLGLTLHQKWNQVMEFATSLTKQGKSVHSEALQLAKKSIEPKEQTEEPPEQSKSSKTVKPDVEKEKALKAELETKQRLSELFSNMETSALSADLLDEMSSLVKESVKLQETKDIEEQKKLYVKWEEERVAILKAHQEEIRKEEALKRIEKQKLELLEKEKEIFFFENEDKLDIMIESREETESKIEKKERIEKEDKALKDADYVPPEVFKRYK